MKKRLLTLKTIVRGITIGRDKMDENLLLETWNYEYIDDENAVIRFDGYNQLSTSTKITLGRCTCYYDAKNNSISSVVVLDDRCKNMPDCLVKAILWHEFCHHWDAYSGSFHVDHCKSFQRLKWSKPLYALLDIIAKVVSIFY